MTANIDNVVYSAADPVIPLMISACAIASELKEERKKVSRGNHCIVPQMTYIVTLVVIQIRLHEPLVRAPDCSRHTGPWLLDSQNSLNIVSV